VYFEPASLAKVRRTSVLSHYGIKTLLYGTLLPAPDIGRECARIMRDTRDMGFEAGIHTWDHVLWQDNVAQADAQWTRRQMDLACERFEEIFGEQARVHGAAGWQMNRHALPAHAAARFQLLLRHARQRAFRAGLQGRDYRLPAVADYTPHAG
jgi:peptidoglycan/xylan/chitin deacetylase (PgdA/CDA1 family)